MDNLCNVTTGRARFSFVHLYKPYAYQPGQEEKYQVTVLVPKSDVDTKARIDAAIEAAKQKGISEKWNGVCPPIVSTPVYDGDGVRPSDGMAFGPECKGHWVFTASAKADYPPEIVDVMGNPIINQSEVYSGMYGRVNVTFFPYMFGGKKGIGCGLGPVQKLEDGEYLEEACRKHLQYSEQARQTLSQLQEHHSLLLAVHRESIRSRAYQCNKGEGVLPSSAIRRRT